MHGKMDPNVTVVMNGQVSPDMLRELVESWQRANGLMVDGVLGPQTRGAITLVLMANDKRTPRPTRIYSSISIAERAVAIAVAEIGRGEDPKLGNNQGHDIERYKAYTGLGSGGSDAWCAVFMSYCFKMAAGGKESFELSAGAKKLLRSVSKVGREPAYPETGAVICWHRGIKLDWRGHVGIVEQFDRASDTLTVIEGNKGSPARVARFIYPAGLWRQRLYGVAVL